MSHEWIPARWRAIVVLSIAVALLGVSGAAQSVRTSMLIAYASVGEELTAFGVDIDAGTLTKQSSVTLPGFVQEAWASPSTPFFYVAWSNGGASYGGSGVTGRGDRHGVTAFRIGASGMLQAHGQPAALRARPIHVTGDGPGSHLLVAYNDPSGISVHAINRDGTLGAEVPPSGAPDAGIYGHQVRVFPTNRAVVLVTRGNQATRDTKEDPGALKVFRYDAGKLTNRASIAPGNGHEFRSRHLDFHPTRPWAFLTLESQNRLEVFEVVNGDTFGTRALFSKSTLAGSGSVAAGQTTSTVHVHPNGRFVYVANRGGGTTNVNGTAVSAGGANDIAVFRINETTGEPTLVQNADTHGFTPRTFAIDPGGRLLIVGNQTTMAVREGETVKSVPANLSVFRIKTDGTLEFVRKYDVGVGRKPLWWMGLVTER